MNKYISPTIEVINLHTVDVITSSNGVKIGTLEGVDNAESKTAIFDVNHWFVGI